MSTEITLLVEGMTCQHCVKAVSAEVEALDGIEGISIDVVPDGHSTLRVSSDGAVSRDVLAGAVVAAGYTVVDQ